MCHWKKSSDITGKAEIYMGIKNSLPVVQGQFYSSPLLFFNSTSSVVLLITFISGYYLLISFTAEIKFISADY